MKEIKTKTFLAILFWVIISIISAMVFHSFEVGIIKAPNVEFWDVLLTVSLIGLGTIILLHYLEKV